jgi:hypothetical protein
MNSSTTCRFKPILSRNAPSCGRILLVEWAHPSPVSQPMKIIEPPAEIQAQESWSALQE